MVSILLAATMLLGLIYTMAEEKVTLTIYAQYADDDTKVPYDYTVEKLAGAFPEVELD